MAKKETTSKNNPKKNIKHLDFTSSKVPVNKLRWECPTSTFNFKSTKELKPLNEIVGQERAIEGIKIGATIKAKGYNIFVTGLSGTGRLSTVQALLEGLNDKKATVYDYCYVNNFKDESEPILLKFPQGQAKIFAEQMKNLISYLSNRLPKLFEESRFLAGKQVIIDEYQANEIMIYNNFDEKIRKLGFVRAQYENSQGTLQTDIFALVEGQPVHIDEWQTSVAQGKIPAENIAQMKEQYLILRNELFDISRESFKNIQGFNKRLNDYDKKEIHNEITRNFDELKTKFQNIAINKYLDEVQKYVENHSKMFFDAQSQINDANEEIDENKFRIFSVNIVLDNSETKYAPVISETTPTYSNLFGSIDRVFDKNSGYWKTDFTKIKAGSLLKADQGFLIMNSDDLFNEIASWQALKRLLLYEKLEIMNYENYLSLSQATLKPEPIYVNLKVVVIGGESLYQLLYHYEKGFKKIFKTHAQFDYETARTQKMLMNYARFLRKICLAENLPDLDTSGVAAIVEWAVERAEAQNKITLRFTDVADVLREAAILIDGKKKSLINRKIVEEAIKQRTWRNNLLDEKIKLSIEEGDMLIDTKGERIGQINALTVYNNGITSFGKPARITATVASGNDGIINIEREADLSGNIHNKGMLIITSFLREKFSSQTPLSFTASIAFEQSYGGIDGDSASAAEIYALLSAIANVPIKQSIAITGSVNQKGDIQPIGGVVEKITGFYEICRDRGFTGEQGIIIPEQNVKNLMLNNEIVDAVRRGKFTIYAIKSIDKGAEILMGLPAGKLIRGKYPDNSLYGKVIERIIALDKASNKSKDKE